MIQKIIVPVLFVGAQFIISWYGYFTGKLPAQGTIFGITYDSVFVRILLTQLKYVWVLILLNFLYSLGFHYGFLSYRNFLVIAIIWIASAPIAALIFNTIFVKEKLDFALVAGIVLVAIGAVSVIAHKEIMKLFA